MLRILRVASRSPFVHSIESALLPYPTSLRRASCMPIATDSLRFTCTSCLRARYAPSVCYYRPQRGFASSPPHYDNGTAQPQQEEKKERGALSARLEQMSEEALETGGSAARKAVQEAGFDEDLKRRLEERIASASFRAQNTSAFAQAELPSSAGKGTKDIAAAAPWSGTESVEDASLRMLNDAYKPLKAPRGSGPRGPPVRVDTGRSSVKVSSGARLATARDKTSIYTSMKMGMTEQEKEQYRKEMKARFAPGARSLPATLQGLASLANERIEDAIARGQFKNLPRGKNIERDYAANSPFLDTTEYFMNKIIQRQDIVPPWIEKQQELIATANKFRARLRNEWKRHAARMIASKGGSLEVQVQRAKEYAAAEAIVNPPKKRVETMTSMDSTGHMSQISVSGQLVVTPGDTGTTQTHIEVQESSGDASSTATMDVTNEVADPTPAVRPAAQPYRDAAWEANERGYHELSITNLNSITRSYNLIAPQMAQKPYYNLERELKACFAEIAPQLPGEILERATRPKVKVEVITHKPGSLLEQTFQRQSTRVYDENLQVKGYGFKQFWQDLWRKDKGDTTV